MAEKRTIELEIQDNSKTLKQQYKEAVVELQKMAAAYGEMSDEAVAAAKRAAELKDQIEDTNDLMKSFKGEGAFIAMNKAMTTVASGFSAIEGGLALVGVEGEAVQQTMLKVQAAMALAQGLEGLEDAGRAFQNLGVVAGNALKGIRTGIAATGIGVLLIAVGALVAYWDDIKGAVSGVTEQQKKLNKESAKNAQAAKETYDNFQLQENSLKLQSKSEKEILQLKINKLNSAIKLAEVDLKRLEDTSKLEVAAAKRNQEITKNIIRGATEFSALGLRLLTTPIDLVLKTANTVSEALGFGQITAININDEITKLTTMAADIGSKFLFDPEQVKSESDAAIKQAKQGLAQMKSDRDGFLLQIKQSTQQGAQNNVNTEQGAAQEQIDITRQMEEENNRLMAEGRAKDLDALRIKYKYEQQEADKNFKEGKLKKDDYDKLSNQAIESKRLDEKAINDKYDQIEEDEKKQRNDQEIADMKKLDEANFAAFMEGEKIRIEALKEGQEKERELRRLAYLQEAQDLQNKLDNNLITQGIYDQAVKNMSTKLNKDLDDIDAKYTQQQKDRKLQLAQKTLDLSAQSFSALSELAGSFNTKNEKDAKRQFRIQKAFNLAAAITNTAMAVTAALTGGGNVAKIASSANFVEAGIAAAVGAANIIKIANSKFEGGGGGDSGGNDELDKAASGSITANFSTIGGSGINQLAQLQQQPLQAYVVSGEVTSAQALDRNRVQNATL